MLIMDCVIHEVTCSVSHCSDVQEGTRPEEETRSKELPESDPDRRPGPCYQYRDI